jgi:photosystem II stability/assembly factor-like uncharacterized protein
VRGETDIVYVGMGEVALRGVIMQGDGAYRRSDGGRTWQHIGLSDSHAIGRIRVHPTECDVAYAAVLGHPYGPSAERGVFRTRNGGQSWERVLHRNTRAGAVDLVMDPANPDVLYAGFWEVQRTPWTLESGGAGSGLFKSTDGGNRWTELTQSAGLPAGIWARSASRSRARTRTASGPSSKRTRAACSAPTTVAAPGNARTATAACGSARSSTPASTRIRRTARRSTC